MSRYIDAETLIKKIFPYDIVDKRLYSINAKAIYEEIKEAPTADVAEVRHGKWIEQVREYEKYWVTEGFKCSICGLELMDNDYKYCPECGAKMSDVI